MKTQKELIKENIVDDKEHNTYNSGIVNGIAAAFKEYALTDDEKEWILFEIDCSVSSIRIDDGDKLTFDKEIFDEGDFVKYKIKMLSELHDKIKEKNDDDEKYAIVIKPFTKEEAKKTKANICDEMHMDESIFHIKEV